MTLLEILSIIFIHWIADFVLQTDEMAKGKSKYWEPLLSHTIVYSCVFAIAGILYINYLGPEYKIWDLFNFLLIT